MSFSHRACAHEQQTTNATHVPYKCGERSLEEWYWAAKKHKSGQKDKSYWDQGSMSQGTWVRAKLIRFDVLDEIQAVEDAYLCW